MPRIRSIIVILLIASSLHALPTGMYKGKVWEQGGLTLYCCEGDDLMSFSTAVVDIPDVSDAIMMHYFIVIRDNVYDRMDTLLITKAITAGMTNTYDKRLIVRYVEDGADYTGYMRPTGDSYEYWASDGVVIRVPFLLVTSCPLDRGTLMVWDDADNMIYSGIIAEPSSAE